MICCRSVFSTVRRRSFVRFFASQRRKDSFSRIFDVRWLSNKRNRCRSRFHASSGDSVDTSLWAIVPKSFAIGSVAGVFGSLAGMGGGFIMIPLMTSSLLRLSQHKAHATSLCAVMATGCAGALSYGSDNDFDVVQCDVALAIAVSGMVAARFGARATPYFSEQILRKMLGGLMLIMAPVVPAKAYFMEQFNDEQQDGEVEDSSKSLSSLSTLSSLSPWTSNRMFVLAMIGTFSGFLAGVFGVGGGVVVVPALSVALNMNHHQALGTSLAAMALPAAVGVYTHYTLGNVAKRVAPPLALGAFVGSYVGASFGLTTNEAPLRWGFAGILTTLGIRTLITK